MRLFRCLISGFAILVGCSSHPKKVKVIENHNSKKLLKEFIPQLEANGWYQRKSVSCGETKEEALCLVKGSVLANYYAVLEMPKEDPSKIRIEILLYRNAPHGTIDKLHEELSKIFE